MADIYYYMGTTTDKVNLTPAFTQVFLLADVQVLANQNKTQVACKELVFCSGGGSSRNWWFPYVGSTGTVSLNGRESFNVYIDSFTPHTYKGNVTVPKQEDGRRIIYAPFGENSIIKGNYRLEGENFYTYDIRRVAENEEVDIHRVPFNEEHTYIFDNRITNGTVGISSYFHWNTTSHNVQSNNGGNFASYGEEINDISPHILLVDGTKPGENNYAPSTTMSSIKFYIEKDPNYYTDTDYLKIKCVPLDAYKQGTTIEHYSLIPTQLNGRSVFCVELAKNRARHSEYEDIPVERIAEAAIDYLSKYSIRIFPYTDSPIVSEMNDGRNVIDITNLITKGPTVLPVPIPEDRVVKSKINYIQGDRTFCELTVRMSYYVGHNDEQAMREQGIVLSSDMIDKIKIWVEYEDENELWHSIEQESSFYETTDISSWESGEVNTFLSWTLPNVYENFQLKYEITTHNASYYTPPKIVTSNPIRFMLIKSDGVCTYIKINNEWKTGVPFIKINDSYKTVSQAFIKVNNEWKTIL